VPGDEITFQNARGVALSGVLQRGKSVAGAGAPAVLLCQGLSGVKHLVLPEIADGLAEHGITSLRFDYSGFGASEGERGWIDPSARTDDAFSALAWLGTDDEVDSDRLGVYGHSYGGPVAISVTARDPRVRAVVSVSGPGDGVAMLRAPRPAWDWVAFRKRVEAERAHVATGGTPTEVPVTDLLPLSPAFLAAYEKLKASQGGSSAEQAGSGLGISTFFLGSADAMLDFDVAGAARRLGGRPLLLVHGADDDTAPIETVEPVYAAAPGPKRWIVVPGAAHNELDAGPGLARAIDAASAWFTEHL
jgi:pimeloyl-ACP methyl ester carboxylesterase